MIDKPRFSGIASNSYKSHLRYRGCVGHWAIIEDGGGTLYDISGRSFHGTLVSSPTRTFGQFGNSISFDGTNYINMGDVLDFERTSPFSVSCWFKSSVADIPGNVELLAKRNNAGNFEGWAWRIRGGTAGDPLRFSLTNTANTSEISINYTRPQDTSWHLYTVTYSGSSTAAGVVGYTDGKVLTPTVILDNLTTTTITTFPLNIGALNGTAGLAGAIDDVRVYNRVLSHKEVASLYSQPFLEFIPPRRSIRFKTFPVLGPFASASNVNFTRIIRTVGY